MAEADMDKLDTTGITQWRSIVTLVVFVLTNINVLFPFHIPIYVPRGIHNAFMRILSTLRIIPPPPPPPSSSFSSPTDQNGSNKTSRSVRLLFPMNLVTAPLIADLFLLAISAIGRTEIRGGTLGTDHISPLDIMIFFVTLAYIAISIDATGLIRWLAYKVLLKGGSSGRLLYFYLYSFFAVVGTLIGNDPIVLSGTPFLAYMTRVSSNIRHPRAWIFAQFAVANVVSAILVSSNPTNLVLAGAFQVRFIDYTANMVVPVVATVVVLFPCLLYLVFRSEELVPRVITLHRLPDEVRSEPPKNPCIPYVQGPEDDDAGLHEVDEKHQIRELAEIMHPFLDKKSAVFGSVLILVTLIIVLVLNAVQPTGGELPVFWITLPAAVVMFLWDVVVGWFGRRETREIARNARAEFVANQSQGLGLGNASGEVGVSGPGPSTLAAEQEKRTAVDTPDTQGRRTTLFSLVSDAWTWCRETLPTATFVLSHLPLALVPFALTMFILVQALVTKGWVPVFAYGWDHWVNMTGTIGAIGGMGFVSVVLCNFAGTNIGTTILICRVLQSWQAIHEQSGVPISNRTFWATVYSMALGVNYGAFSTAFSASLAGLLWRDILSRKRIHIRARDFARFNIPIIASSMVVGLVVLIGEVYITRNTEPYNPRV